MKYYQELIERICMIIEERLYVHVEYAIGIDGYDLTLSAIEDDDFKRTFKVHYRDLEMTDACNYDSPVLRIAQNITSSFTSDYKDSIYRQS